MKKINFPIFPHLIFLFLIALGLIRISLTYNVFWQTYDEPAHIAAGMEWLDKGQYTYELFHPPLARIMNALGLYLDGIKSIGKVSIWDEGNAILHSNGTYEHNLTLARLGTLPFFIIASLVVALWANMYGGAYTALISVILFTTLPPILAHSGFATLDIPCAALVTAALFVLCLWLERQTLLNSHLLGITLGLAILAKFPSLGFLPISGGLIVITYSFRFFFSKSSIANEILLRIRRWIATSIIAILLCSLVIWAGYRFSSSPLLEGRSRPYQIIDRIVGAKGLLHDSTYFITEHIQVPAPEFRKGIVQLGYRNKRGHSVYFLGKIMTKGIWYFYPFVLLLKTPLAFILLVAIGCFFIINSVRMQQEDIRLLAPLVAAIGILIVGMLSNVTNGVRQLLAIYPLLAIVAGYGASKLLSLQRLRHITPGLITVLLLWQIISSFAAHPDYFSYFNALAGKHPEQILTLDFDWGQDLKRLATTVKNRGINDLAIDYHGSIPESDLDQFNFPLIRQLIPDKKTTGWIAISISNLQRGTTDEDKRYSWLKEYQPIEKIGKSIWLYHIPEQ